MIEISVRAIVIAGEITSPILAPAMTLVLSFTSFFSFSIRWIVGRSVASPVASWEESSEELGSREWSKCSSAGSHAPDF